PARQRIDARRGGLARAAGRDLSAARARVVPLALRASRVGVAARNGEAARAARNAAPAARRRALVRQGDRARLRASDARSRPAARRAVRARRRATVHRCAAGCARRSERRARGGRRCGARDDGRRVKALRYFLAAYPARCLAVLWWLLVAGVIEGLGLSTLLPLLSAATGSGVGASGYEAQVARVLAALGIRADPGPLFAIVIGALWIKAILMLLSKRQVGYAVARIATALRLRLLRALLAARWSFSSRQPAGRAANSMATEADRASYAFEYLALIASYSVETTVYVAIAFAVSWRGTLLAGGAAALMLLLLHFLVRMAHRAGRKQTALLDSLLTRTNDTLAAVKLLRATGREDAVGPLLAGDTERLNRQLERRVLARESLRALQEPVVGTLLARGLFAALRIFAIPLSSTLVLGLVFTRALTRVASIQGKYQAMVSETSALWAIDARIREAEAAREPSGGTRHAALERGIAVDSVSRERDGRKLFEDLSLEIPSGRITAVIGASGI